MIKTINKNKYFRVKEITNMDGEVTFKVYGYDSFFDFVFGIHDEYTNNNKTLEEAIDQINCICKAVVKSVKTVYKFKI